MPEKVVGILGGMGPEATIDLYAKITRNVHARIDQDHLHVVIDSNPKVPSRQAAILEGGEDPTDALCAMAENLERAGADFIVIPCNAAHFFLSRVRQRVRIPILSIIEETVRAVRVQLPPVERVGLLASTAVVKTGLYTDAFKEHTITTILPNLRDQRLVQEVILAIKAGAHNPQFRAQLEAVANALVVRGAQVIVLGCTELPLVIGPRDIEVPVIDATEVLALTAIREARGQG
jgi:aspartate racemase